MAIVKGNQRPNNPHPKEFSNQVKNSIIFSKIHPRKISEKPRFIEVSKEIYVDE